MENKNIICSIYCISYSWYFKKLLSDILESKIGEEFEYKHLRHHLLNTKRQQPNEDDVIEILEKAHFHYEYAVLFQNYNAISAHFIEANSDVLKDLIDVLASNDTLFILKNKLWQSPTEIEFQVEIIHEDDLFKYIKN